MCTTRTAPDPDGRFDIGGYGEGEAVRTPDGWRLRRWRFRLLWSDGAGPRPGPAPPANCAAPSPDHVRRKDDETVSGTPTTALGLGALRETAGARSRRSSAGNSPSTWTSRRPTASPATAPSAPRASTPSPR
ncbi:hypothetical protein ACFZDK_30835 [Streptomyces sp. NPDC007901]|uniref:hypothetical protein n=1 Tax=Streptomyces sp. NPDC007901 TaxID=3364785 RepID=UPI0036E6E79D